MAEERVKKKAPADNPNGRHLTQTQRAAEMLRELILSNELPAGSNILESELAQMFNMSRTPTREAILLLENCGLVEVVPRRGFRVRQVSAKDMAEIYAILTELEALAAEEAARKGLQDDELLMFERLLDGMEDALAQDDRAKWAELDTEFHNTLVRITDNKRLIDTINNFHDQAYRARMVTLYMRPPPHESNADHRRLFEAIAAGDAETARREHREHRIRAKDLLMGILLSKGIKAL